MRVSGDGNYIIHVKKMYILNNKDVIASMDFILISIMRIIEALNAIYQD